MKKLITTNISGATKAPFTKPALDNLQGNFSEIPASIIKALLGTYTTNDVIILEGFVITLSNSNNTATWTTGSVYYNGEVYQVASGTLTKSSGVFLYSIVDSITNATFSDGTNNPWIEIRTITITSGTSGTGIADYGATSVKKLYDQTSTGFTISPTSNMSGANIDRINATRKNGKVTYSIGVSGSITAGGSAISCTIVCPNGFKMTPSSSSNLGNGFLVSLTGNTGFSSPPDDISADQKAYIDSSSNLIILVDAPTASSGSFVHIHFTLTRDSL